MLPALVIAAALLVVLGLSAAWWLGVLANRGALGGLHSVQALGAIALPGWGRWVLAAFLVAWVATLVRRRALIGSRAVVAALALGLFSVVGAILSPLGYHASIVAASATLALLAAAHLPAPAPVEPNARTDRTIALAAWIAVAAVHCVFSMHRYWAYGAGSWDMGCMVHNLYRASRFLDSTSTVLGEVDFLGDHFMIGIYLYAPIFWINSSGYALLLIQAVSLASTAPAIYLVARGRGAPPIAAAVLAFAAGLAFGMQSAAYFDSHEITIGLGFCAWAIWAIESKRYRAASVLIAVFALFKESLGAYVVGLGLLLLWRAIRDGERKTAIYGGAWIGGGALWFLLVNRVFMPALIKRANPPEPHETFADFGGTIFQALIGIVTHPLKAIGAVFVPSEKLHSLLVTFGGLGWLALAAPELLIAALPLFAERFLSSKATMWEMGYHYAAPLTLYAAWAVAIAWPRIEAAARRALDGLAEGFGLRAPWVLAAYLLASAALVNAIGYRHPANYHRWNEPYYSTPARRETNARAIALLDDLDRAEKLAVQNRMLPHLADRPYIYRLGDWQKTDWVLLNVAESAWPWDDGYPRRLARQLAASADWKLVFSEGETAVFARRTAAAPEVQPAPSLGLR